MGNRFMSQPQESNIDQSNSYLQRDFSDPEFEICNKMLSKSCKQKCEIIF